MVQRANVPYTDQKLLKIQLTGVLHVKLTVHPFGKGGHCDVKVFMKFHLIHGPPTVVVNGHKILKKTIALRVGHAKHTVHFSELFF